MYMSDRNIELLRQDTSKDDTVWTLTGILIDRVSDEKKKMIQILQDELSDVDGI